MALISLFKHFLPNIDRMLDEGVENEVSSNKIISSMAYFCLVFILAPFLFPITILQTASDTYKEKMYETLIEKN